VSDVEVFTHSEERVATAKIAIMHLRMGHHASGVDARILRVLDHVQSNVSGKLAVDDLADIACMSRAHFARVFKRQIGVSVAVYVRTSRCLKAAHALIGSDMDICQIAFDCGFESQSHFTRCFKVVLGQTPGRYRMSHGHGGITCAANTSRLSG